MGKLLIVWLVFLLIFWIWKGKVLFFSLDFFIYHAFWFPVVFGKFSLTNLNFTAQLCYKGLKFLSFCFMALNLFFVPKNYFFFVRQYFSQLNNCFTQLLDRIMKSFFRLCWYFLSLNIFLYFFNSLINEISYINDLFLLFDRWQSFDVKWALVVIVLSIRCHL